MENDLGPLSPYLQTCPLIKLLQNAIKSKKQKASIVRLAIYVKKSVRFLVPLDSVPLRDSQEFGKGQIG
jgi:hypothetical protein